MVERLPACSMEEYHRRSELSSSQLAAFVDDPIEWYYVHVRRQWKPRKASAAMNRGTITHEVIEEGLSAMLSGGIEKVVQVVPDEVLGANGALRNRKGEKQWDEWKSTHPAKHYLKVGQPNPWAHMLAHLQANETTKLWMDAEDKEVTLIGNDHVSGLALRVRLDVVDFNDERPTIVDWKTCRDNSPDSFQKEIFYRSYDLRLAMYALAASKWLGETPRVAIAAIKNCGGYSVRPYYLDDRWVANAGDRLASVLEDIAAFDLDEALNAGPLVLKAPYAARRAAEYEV